MCSSPSPPTQRHLVCSAPGVPHPRIVDIFASEMGMLVELYAKQQVLDLMAAENRSLEMLALNPDGGTKRYEGTIASAQLNSCPQAYPSSSSKAAW